MSVGGGSEMPMLGHLEELRKRIIRSFYGILIAFFVVYHFAEKIFDFLLVPLCRKFDAGKCPIVYTGVAEPFMVYLKVGVIGALFLAAPWIFLQVWGFVSPALKQSEKRWLLPFVVSASGMFIGGAFFGYFVMFPFAFDFFLTQALPPIQPMLNMSEYFSFISGLMLAFGILFEIPILVILLNLLGILPAATLWKTWRYGVAGIYLLAAVLTPADPYTMILLGTPLAVLYVMALAICSLLESLRAKST